MNANKTRHKILEILSKQFVASETSSENILGVSSENIKNHIKCNNDLKLRELSSVLYENNEVEYHDTYGVIGMFATEKGVASFSEKKYLKIAKKERVESIKDFVQIVIPILSLLVALGAIFFKVENFNNSNEEKFKALEKKIESLKKERKN